MMEPIQCMGVFAQAGRGSWSATEKTARNQHIERAPAELDRLAVGKQLAAVPQRPETP